jgi:hypothetical protein
MRHLIQLILMIIFFVNNALCMDEGFEAKYFDAATIKNLCADFKLKDKEFDECLEQMKLIKRSPFIFCKISNHNDPQETLKCATEKSVDKADKKSSTFICAPNIDETECSTPDGRLYRLVPSVDQTQRDMIKKINSQVDSNDSIKTNPTLTK